MKIVLTISILFLVFCAFFSRFFIVNLTSSMPKGFYLIIEPVNIDYLDIVLFQIPKNVEALVRDRHYVPKMVTSFQKYVYGMPGDTVTISESGVYISGRYLCPVKKKDSQNRPLPQVRKTFTLEPDEYFLLSLYPESFDSRYFGIITSAQIKKKLIKC